MARTHDDARDKPQPGDRYVFNDTLYPAYDEVLEVMPDGDLNVRMCRRYGDTDKVISLDYWTFGNEGCWVPCAE